MRATTANVSQIQAHPRKSLLASDYTGPTDEQIAEAERQVKRFASLHRKRKRRLKALREQRRRFTA
jgi:hypothetical protein